MVRAGRLLGEAFRGELGSGKHAEYCVLSKLQNEDISDADVYTTLEPCSRRGEGKTPCADRLIERKVGTVFIGMYDPDPRIHFEGWSKLRDAGIVLRDFDPALREEIRSDNMEFIGQFRHAIGIHGAAKFDYTQNDGRFIICADDALEKTFETKWTPRASGSIYALDYAHNVAHPRYHAEVNEIDDPSALDFESYSCGVAEGEVVVFRNASGYALVKVTGVLNREYGDDRFELCFSYELRLTD